MNIASDKYGLPFIYIRTQLDIPIYEGETPTPPFLGTQYPCVLDRTQYSKGRFAVCIYHFYSTHILLLKGAISTKKQNNHDI